MLCCVNAGGAPFSLLGRGACVYFIKVETMNTSCFILYCRFYSVLLVFQFNPFWFPAILLCALHTVYQLCFVHCE